MSRVLQAVIFDMDGLLIDSEPLWYEVEGTVMARLGNTWSTEQQVLLLGGSMQNTVDYLLSQADPAVLSAARPAVTPAVVEGWLVAEMLQRIARGVPMRPGALDLLDAVAAAGIPAGLVSSSYRVLIDAVLDVLGAGRFDVSVAGDEVTRPKPHPEAYLRGASLLRVQPRDAVVLEDSDSGTRAAVAAGFVTVCVPSVAVIPAGPGRVLRDSLVGITVDWLAGLLPLAA